MSPRILATAGGHRSPTGAAFDIVLLLHVVAVVVGLGAVAASGIQAARLLSASRAGQDGPAPDVPASIREYFAPGVNWVGRVLYAVPVLGFALLELSHGAFGVDDAWVQAGLGLWVAAAVVAEWLHWPAERRIQNLLLGELSGDGWTELRRACRSVCVTASGLAGLLLAAVVLMVSRP
ncbi:MAG: hypothetical protein ACYDHU_10945 [Acidimicrobiales bacterium]